MRLIEDLQPLSLGDYEQVIEKYAAECATIRGVRGIHQFGSIGAPGLSDIDLVVVLDDDAPLGDVELTRISIKHERWQREPLVRRCFTHDVYVCSSSVFTHIDWLIPGNRWTRRAGAEEGREPPAGEDREIVALAHGLDFCIGRLHELAHLNGAPRSVRSLVTELWSLTHTWRLLADAGASLEHSWSDVIAALDNLRATPVPEIRPGIVQGLVPVVLEHFAKAVDHFAALLAERAQLGACGPERECAVALYSRRTLHVYHAAGNPGRTRVTATALARRFRFAGRTVEAAWSRIELPGSVLPHHLAYLGRDPRHAGLSSRIARRSGVSLGELGSTAYRRVIATRMDLARRSEQPVRARHVRLSGFRVPGLPIPSAAVGGGPGTWRLRAVRSWLDWRMLPADVVGVGPG